MNVSLEYLQRCADQTGYRVEPLEKVVRLGGMAADVARHPFLGSVLALKGGTAFNLCFGPPKRLSVDLDYNYIGHLDRAAMLEARPAVEQAVADLARRQGYRVQQSADAFAGRKYYLLYRSVLGPEERIEVDLNFLFRMPIAGTELRELWQPGELDRPSIGWSAWRKSSSASFWPFSIVARCGMPGMWPIRRHRQPMCSNRCGFDAGSLPWPPFLNTR